MGPVPRLLQKIACATSDNFFPEGHEGLEHVREVHLLRLAAIERNNVRAEGRLQLAEPVKLVQNNIGNRIAFQLDHDPHAGAIALVTNIRDPFNALVTNKFGDLFNHRRLVHLIRDFSNDESVSIFPDFLDINLGPHRDGATAIFIGIADARAAENDTCCRKVRTWNNLHELGKRHGRIFHDGDRRVDHLTQVVRRYVGGHPDGNAAGSVD